MRKMKNVLFIMALMFTSLISAQSITEIDTTNVEFVNKLKNIPFPVENDIIAKAYVKFNDSNKIIEIRVDSKNASINNFIKTRLIYEKFETTEYKPNQTYYIPIKVISRKE